MKKLVLIALALVTLQVGAQNEKPDFRRGDRKQRAERFKDLSPEEMSELQTKRLTLALDLTEAQQKEIQKLELENAKLRKERRDERQAKMKESQQRPSKEERLAMMNDQLDRQIEMKQKMKQILNGDQYEKWQKMQENRNRQASKKPKRGRQ